MSVSSVLPDAVHREEFGRRAREVFPAGSNGEFDLPDDLTTVIASGDGYRLLTADGREMLDFSMGWGSVLPGHARAEIVEAVGRAAASGCNFATVTHSSLALAERLIEISPACDLLRFCASGTEATMYCLRLARAATGRARILRFEGAYHGGNDLGTVSLFPKELYAFPEPEPTSVGVDRSAVEDTLVAPFNDLEYVGRLMTEFGHELAAVIVEPFHRCLSPAEGFLEGLRALCDQHGVVLIFDEVVTGFRMALGGAQERYGVVPDLVAYGKALGGGLPIGVFGGRADLMEYVCEHRMHGDPYVWTASTLGGNPISCAASLAAIDLYEQPDTYPRLYGLGQMLREVMRVTLKECDIDAQVVGDGPLAQVVFSAEPVTDYRSTKRGDAKRARAVMLELFRRGIFLNPMGTKLYLSLAHDETAIEQFGSCFRDSLEATR